MRAVWSFWTKPFQSAAGRNHWASEFHHALCWALSVETARPHFDELVLVTDDDGAKLLVDQLRLPFTRVSLLLNDLQAHDPDWWMQGKLHTYRAQTEPFVHIDYDVFLWKPLPERLLRAPVFAQNPEDARSDSAWYDTGAARYVLDAAPDGWVPQEWRWYDTLRGQTAPCTGIFGGNDVRFVQRYADTVIRFLEHPGNRTPFDALPNKEIFNPMFEQYLLSACAAWDHISIDYLFPSFEEALAPGAAAQAGFTHLQADGKLHADVLRRLEARVRRDYPDVYARCLRACGRPAATHEAIGGDLLSGNGASAIPKETHTEVELSV